MSKSVDGGPLPSKENRKQGTGKPARKTPPHSVGDALRSAYQRTLDEDIPPEMLDLLGKLG